MFILPKNKTKDKLLSGCIKTYTSFIVFDSQLFVEYKIF